MALWIVQAQRITTHDGWIMSAQIPTFYVEAMDAENAKKIARDILVPERGTVLEVHMHADTAYLDRFVREDPAAG